LSKGILEMKFMMKTKVKVDKEAEEDEGKHMYQNEITDKMGSNSNFLIEPSFVNIEELSVCRFSCRGMNPEIEKLLLNEKLGKEAATKPKMETEVSDKEMATFYNKTNDLIKKEIRIHKKLKNKRVTILIRLNLDLKF
uniref:M-phase phosphoprotein 6 n=1 Tax=Megaselia scalaris TaxID=36166 RepID=T1H6H5_MEGSC